MKLDITVRRRGAGALRGRVLTAGVALALLAALAACSDSELQEGAIGYVVDGAVPTYNANTIEGASSAARQAFARTSGGFSFAGPGGASVADLDFGAASVVPGDRLMIDYQINPAATYSDGAPVVCDDMVLAWAAGSGNFTSDDATVGLNSLFDAATVPGMADIESIDCTPGAKSAVVSFRPGRAVTDWRALFAATTMAPAHVVSAGSGGANIVRAVQDRDDAVMAEIADFWNTGFTLVPGEADPEVFVSSGPYRLESVGEDGRLSLTANELWWGDAPRTDQITVWPRSADVEELLSGGKVQVVDIRTGSAEVGDTPDGLALTTAESNGIEQLTLSTTGSLESVAARTALALCVPRGDAGSPADSRLALANTLAYPFVSGTVDGRYQNSDAEAAKTALTKVGLDGLSLRIGYTAPDPGRARLVTDIAAACAPAGIAVEDASAPDFDPSWLDEGKADAVVGGAGGGQLAGGALSDNIRAAQFRGNTAGNVGGFENSRFDEIADQLAVTTSATDKLNLQREAEAILWEELPSLPLHPQTRTLILDSGLRSGSPNASETGAGWNMDRWEILR